MALLHPRQIRWLLAAALLFALSSAVALLQPPQPDPYRSFRPRELSWWLYPLEEHSFQRLPHLAGLVTGIANPPGTKQLWAVGARGLVITSKDAGHTWTQSHLSIREQQPSKKSATPTPTPGTSLQEDFQNIYFFDSNHGWVLAVDTLLLTTDGGKTWQKSVDFPDDWVLGLPASKDLHFTSPKVGWLTSGDLHQTGDGGLHWQLRSIGVDDNWRSIHFFDSKHGWIVGSESVAATINGGATWSSKSIPFQDFESGIDIFFLDPNRGWILGDEGSIFATDNGGATWKLLTRLRDGDDVSKIHFLTRDRGWLLFGFADFGLLTTKDGGP